MDKLWEILEYTGLIEKKPTVPEHIKHPEHIKMMKDIKKHGDEQRGTFKNIKWYMRRPYSTYWCGYVRYEGKLTDTQSDELEHISHGGLTSGIGFDCAHWGDYAPHKITHIDKLWENGRYRDYDYVYDKICKMIDYIVDGTIDGTMTIV